MNLIRLIAYSAGMAYMNYEWKNAADFQTSFMAGFISVMLLSGWLYTLLVMWEEAGDANKG
jgi:hypothetical protein